jgi:replication-associated recombination protein RarA
LGQARAVGQARGAYENPHERPGHIGEQELMPAGLERARFYAPDQAEQLLVERLDEIRKARGLGA